MHIYIYIVFPLLVLMGIDFTTGHIFMFFQGTEANGGHLSPLENGIGEGRFLEFHQFHGFMFLLVSCLFHEMLVSFDNELWNSHLFHLFIFLLLKAGDTQAQG